MNILRFFTMWGIVFLVSYAALSFTGMIPQELAELNSRAFDVFSLNVAAVKSAVAPESTVPDTSKIPSSSVKETILPDRILIEKIGVDAPVINPESRDIKVLDNSLLSGVVRFPGSGGLDDESNMFLFGHSTNWAVVHNQSFKSFNRLGELQIGDIITVRSGTDEYHYRVFSVSQVNKDKALVELQSGEKLLTLSTCDSFGERSDRFIVQARFLEVLPSRNN